MSLSNLLPSVATQSRRTARLFTTTSFPFTAAFVRTDSAPVRVKFNGTALAGAVTCTVTGELNGTPQTENLTISGVNPSVLISTKRWTKITQISSSTSTTGALFADAIDPNGQLSMAITVIATGLRVRLSRIMSRVDDQLVGPRVIERTRLYAVGDALAQEDLVTIDGATYQIQTINRPMDRSSTHHTEADVVRAS